MCPTCLTTLATLATNTFADSLGIMLLVAISTPHNTITSQHPCRSVYTVLKRVAVGSLKPVISFQQTNCALVQQSRRTMHWASPQPHAHLCAVALDQPENEGLCPNGFGSTTAKTAAITTNTTTSNNHG